MKNVFRVYQSCLKALLNNDAHHATKFCSPTRTIRATRRLYGNKINKSGPIEVQIRDGKPNFEEREFIKACKKAGEPFPVRKIQLRYPPNSRKPSKAVDHRFKHFTPAK
jgi:hypothetical protein